MAEKTIKEAMRDFIVGYALPEYMMQYPDSTPIEQDDYVRYLILTILQEQGPDIKSPVRPFQMEVVKNKKGEFNEVPVQGRQPKGKKPGFQPGRGLTQYNEDFLVEAKRLQEKEDRKNKVPGTPKRATPNPELMKQVLESMDAENPSEGALSDVEEYETLSKILPLMRAVRTNEKYKGRPTEPWQQVEAVQKAGKSKMEGGEFKKNLVETLLKQFTTPQPPPEEPESYYETALRILGLK